MDEDNILYLYNLCKSDGEIHIKIVELYPDMESENINDFNRYISGYTDVLSKVVNAEKIEEIKKVVEELYKQSH